MLRVDELHETAIARRGFAFEWPTCEGPALPGFPLRDDFITFLAIFRQFFLHDGEPVKVHRVVAAFRKCVPDEELLTHLCRIERILDAPFQSSLCLTIGDKEFAPKDLMEAWISRYLHSDSLPPELMAITGSEWQFCIEPLMQYFYVGIQVLDQLRSLILEAKKRGAVQPDLSFNRPVE